MIESSSHQDRTDSLTRYVDQTFRKWDLSLVRNSGSLQVVSMKDSIPEPFENFPPKRIVFSVGITGRLDTTYLSGGSFPPQEGQPLLLVLNYFHLVVDHVCRSFNNHIYTASGLSLFIPKCVFHTRRSGRERTIRCYTIVFPT